MDLIQSVEGLNKTKRLTFPQEGILPFWWPLNWDIGFFLSSDSNWNISYSWGAKPASIWTEITPWALLVLCPWTWLKLYLLSSRVSSFLIHPSDLEICSVDLISQFLIISLCIYISYCFCFSGKPWLIQPFEKIKQE